MSYFSVFLTLISLSHLINGFSLPSFNLSFFKGETSAECFEIIESNGSTSVRCMPAFIIAGTQKSGTTALATLLSSSCYIKFPPQKEVHFFDLLKNFNQGIEYYLKKFEPVARTNRSNLVNRVVPMYGEASPFYLASRDACRRIAETKPNMKLIVLLREPVARAYSEYQMKFRRVALQEEFFMLMNQETDVKQTFSQPGSQFNKHTISSALLHCMHLHQKNISAVGNCAPVQLTMHNRWSKLSLVLKKSYNRPNVSWDDVVTSCFSHDGNEFNYQVFAVVEPNRTYVATNTSAGTLFSSVRFDAASCWKSANEPLETVKTVREAFWGEVQAFKRCAAEAGVFNGSSFLRDLFGR
jgi:hypothetical protein